MSQIDLNGNPEQPSPHEKLWAKLEQMHRDGYYEVRQNAQQLLDEGYFSEEWNARTRLNAAMRDIEEALRGRNPDGTRRAIKTEKVRQYRLWEWATFDQALGDIKMRVEQVRRDEAAIAFDAGALIHKYPRKRKKVLEALPAHIRLTEK